VCSSDLLTFERKKMHVCEVTLSAKSLKLSAKASSHDMYQSIDEACQRLEKQAHKEKDIRVERRQGDTRRSPSARVSPSDAMEAGEIKVIRASKIAVKPMTVDEAALQLASSKDEFLVFSNAESNNTCVVYKRKDKRIGLIEQEY
jgi:putative sigma-54 modulation protein